MIRSSRIVALMAAATLVGGVAFAQDDSAGDPVKGEKVFKKCKACHKLGEGAKNAVGPLLNDVMGRTAGMAEGYKYSASMIAAGEAGLVWSEELVARFVENPKVFLRDYLDDASAKTKMTIKIKKEKDRANVAAYVATFSTPVAE